MVRTIHSLKKCLFLIHIPTTTHICSIPISRQSRNYRWSRTRVCLSSPSCIPRTSVCCSRMAICISCRCCCRHRCKCLQCSRIANIIAKAPRSCNQGKHTRSQMSIGRRHFDEVFSKADRRSDNHSLKILHGRAAAYDVIRPQPPHCH